MQGNYWQIRRIMTNNKLYSDFAEKLSMFKWTKMTKPYSNTAFREVHVIVVKGIIGEFGEGRRKN